MFSKINKLTPTFIPNSRVGKKVLTRVILGLGEKALRWGKIYQKEL